MESAPTPDSQAVLVARDVEVDFGAVHAVRGVSLEVRRGETVCIIGASGSGKSTFLRVLNGLQTASRGEVWLGSLRVDPRDRRVRAVRQRIGMVFQSFELFPHLTALDNVTLALRRVSKWDRRRAEEVGRALLERVGLEDKVGSYPSQLSGGQQQRVAIARALATSPDLMLFDEPTSALDAEMVGEVLAVIKELVQEGMTMIVVTHELRFASEAADRLVVFSEGVVVEEGNPSDVLTAPKSEPTRALVRHLLAE